ncbi:hypothetical protein I79_005124 [Cricetulus griseus]|uniref:Uncharacterized protein n=1 Tax=Cricetulus griseus TaxID=10029 RepID=G3H4C3_CRIGR|nr:hypothetical protein I79_005124 [Cricetulus griseus]
MTEQKQSLCQPQGWALRDQRSSLLTTCLCDEEDAGSHQGVQDPPGPSGSSAQEATAVEHWGLEFTSQQLISPLPAEPTVRGPEPEEQSVQPMSSTAGNLTPQLPD